jgi:N-carbamoyl-L-amino-acid hydrolase
MRQSSNVADFLYSMILPHLKINAERLQADFEEISQIGLTENGGISRLALSREDLQARAWLADQIETAGLLIHDDDAGNLSGILRSENPGARTLLIGSHLDTVPNAGRYDGVLGVLAGLECLRTIRESGISLPVHLEVMDFTDDEGAWEPMFGSMSLTKRLPKDVLNSADPTKSAFRAALRRAGINPDEVHRAARDPRTIAAYLELHVEQGARLEHSATDIGVVTAIVGRTSYNIRFIGQAGHAGTASMHDRRDALQGACQFVTQAHDLIREEFVEGSLNCGNLEVKPGSLTIIPNAACVTIECRHPNEEVLAQMEAALIELAHDCAHQHRLEINLSPITRIPAAQMNPLITQCIEKACATLGVSYQELASYASHNAQIMSTFVPSGMFFIPSVGGISHNPAEYSHWEDVVNGTNVMLHTILMLALSE